MFRKILIANRGEIAVRILRTCRKMGIKTVAVYSDVEQDLLHVKLADEAICIGPASSGKSYLNSHNVISAALMSGADAIHPGYGFLSENPHFTEICESHQIRLIGPSSETMKILGDKAAARALAEKCRVPVIPGTSSLPSVREAGKFAEKIGYPILIKAAAGGGGKGMRVVYNSTELEKNYPIAEGEAEAAFGDSRLYLEKYLSQPRHIEVQILGDSRGKVVAFPERECSLQRKHQKILEESPSLAVSPSERKKIQEMAVKIGKEIRYVGAGTIEFLRGKEGKFYFIEGNARIQVEHPVTEMLTGLDLVEEQIRVCQGKPLSIREEEIKLQGHAIECRINAEDPETFSPSSGTIERLHWPGGPGIRVDTHVRALEKIPPFYDSLLGKIIALGKNRKEATARMEAALGECEITGIKTNLPLHLKLLRHPAFQEGKVDVHFVENFLSAAAGHTADKLT